MTDKKTDKKAVAGKTVRVTQMKSVSGRLKRHKACVAGLGLRRIGHTVEVLDTPSNRGMINKVSYMLRVEGE
ncbi:MAG: 50S ribosomal protein L30 [Pseudomonadales bacterium]|nr:50S ribosomal protein L30 [Pseudomonadales bacterium]